MFLKNRNIISKIKRSKVTDYAALSTKIPRTGSNVFHREIYIYFCKKAFFLDYVFAKDDFFQDLAKYFMPYDHICRPKGNGILKGDKLCSLNFVD